MTSPAHVPGTVPASDPVQPGGHGPPPLAGPADEVAAVRRSALVAGSGILGLAVLAGAANIVVIQGLITPGNAARTARDIAASAGLFRLGIAALVIAVVLDVVVAWALLTFFAPVHTLLATLAAWLRLSYAAVFAVAVSQLTGVLPLLNDASPLAAWPAEQRQGEALLKIHAFQDIWNVSLVLFGLHLVLIGYLAWRSGYVPRIIGVLLVIAGAGYLVDSFGVLLLTSDTVTVSAVTFVGEAVFMVWLLVRRGRIDPFSELPAR